MMKSECRMGAAEFEFRHSALIRASGLGNSDFGCAIHRAVPPAAANLQREVNREWQPVLGGARRLWESRYRARLPESAPFRISRWPADWSLRPIPACRWDS